VVKCLAADATLSARRYNRVPSWPGFSSRMSLDGDGDGDGDVGVAGPDLGGLGAEQPGRLCVRLGAARVVQMKLPAPESSCDIRAATWWPAGGRHR